MAVSVLVRLLETHGVRRRVRSIREKSWRRRSRSGPHWRIALRKLVALASSLRCRFLAPLKVCTAGVGSYKREDQVILA